MIYQSKLNILFSGSSSWGLDRGAGNTD